MIKLLRSIGQAIFGLFDALVEFIKSVVSFAEWVPMITNFVSGSVVKFVPSILLPIFSVIVVVYLLKLFTGGDNS